MISEWKTARIEDIAEKVGMGPFGSSIKVETYVPFGVPVINGQHLSGFTVNDSVGFNYITQNHAERLKNALVQRGDIVVTHRGSIGQIAYIPKNSKFKQYIISQSQFFIRIDKSKVIPEFLVAYFNTPEGQHKLLANRSQVGVPSISRPVTYLRTIEIPVPSLPEQRAIAHILGTLDDKIELNRRMNETLEAMAQALFKSWFVDFDPVRAKAEGRDTGLPKEIADLFPDSFEDSELGEIPRGGKVVDFADVANHKRQNIQPDQIDSKTPYIGLEHMPRKSIALSDWSFSDEIESNKSVFTKGDILFGKLRSYFHKVGVAPVNGICSTDILVLSPIKPEWFGFVLGHASSDSFVAYTDMGSSGTRMPRTSWESMNHYKVVLPPVAVTECHTLQVNLIVKKILSNIYESKTLGHLRDSLLPKLLSGEIRSAEFKEE